MEITTSIITDLGFTIASALAAGYFVFLTLKFILTGVITQLDEIDQILKRLNKRVGVITEQTRILDIRLSKQLGLTTDHEKRGS